MSIKIEKNVCRVCVRTDDGTSSFLGIDLFKKFQFYTPQLQFTETDDLPKLLCQKCVGRLIEKSEFKTDKDEFEKLLREGGYQSSTINDSINRFVKIEEIEEDIGILQNVDEKTENFKIMEGKSEANVIYVEEKEVDAIPSENMLSNTSDSKNRSMHMCTQCNKDFSTKTNLTRHMQIHNGAKPHQCTFCGQRFTQNSSLKQHLRIHTGERPHKCNRCGRSFTQSKSLSFHMRRHTGEKPFTCDQCELSFRHKDSLKRHVAVKHMAVELKSHFCSVCEKKLYSKYTLQVHMKRHSDGGSTDESRECETCAKGFLSKEALENHMRKHTLEKPFKCDKCGKEFKQNNLLAIHMTKHRKKLTKNDQTVSHMKKFKCTKCQKMFSEERNLLQHLKKHNRDDMFVFKCDKCNIGFNSPRRLKVHRNNEHKNEVNDLNNCEQVTGTDLNQHMRSTHDKIEFKCEIDNEYCFNKLCDKHFIKYKLCNI